MERYERKAQSSNDFNRFCVASGQLTPRLVRGGCIAGSLLTDRARPPLRMNSAGRAMRYQSSNESRALSPRLTITTIYGARTRHARPPYRRLTNQHSVMAIKVSANALGHSAPAFDQGSDHGWRF